ncbi:ubiquitin-conjugating enzyme E2 D3 [Drosophila ficusphila]|uniref:ubiquitin-conjugating enzyme E2 D3 n=1 Tax=Drosophila ficusphila TaxID=30025 RepID=UPI0007E8097E|nr:ubiquitin-conjugating enzyme E2 D3 [Drosophila ficusphila]
MPPRRSERIRARRNTVAAAGNTPPTHSNRRSRARRNSTPYGGTPPAGGSRRRSSRRGAGRGRRRNSLPAGAVVPAPEPTAQRGATGSIRITHSNLRLWQEGHPAGAERTSESEQICIRRLRKDLSEIAMNPMEGYEVEVVDDNLLHWMATIPGPADSPYAGGRFKLDLLFTTQFPFSPPYIKFSTRIFHCNIATNGYVCLNILRSEWSPALSVSKLLLSIVCLLGDPNPKDPLEAEVALLYISNRAQHDRVARAWTDQYAKP